MSQFNFRQQTKFRYFLIIILIRNLIGIQDLQSDLMAELTKITDPFQNSDYSNSSELFQDSGFAESFGKTRVGSCDNCLFHRKENLDLGRM